MAIKANSPRDQIAAPRFPPLRFPVRSSRLFSAAPGGAIKADRPSPGMAGLLHTIPGRRPLQYGFVAGRVAQPIGVEGELHIGGICLARGYLDLPKLTRENFIPDPFQEGSDMRLYRTGDLARWRTDGSVEFLGRRDNQVKLHGFRIELQEIESVLEAHSQVRTAAVSVREDIPGTSRLVAYIVPTPGQDPRAWELRDYLRASLPAYMVPSSYVTQEALPTGPNGKVDRNALPAPNRDRPDLRAYAEPDTPEEAALERVWADVLGLERVGVLDDFFDLGGNSVLSLEIVSGTRRELGIQLPIAKLFQYPQIRSLAKYLSSGDRGKTLRTETSARARRQREALRRRRFQEAERQ